MIKFALGLALGYLAGYMVGLWVGSYTMKRMEDNGWRQKYTWTN